MSAQVILRYFDARGRAQPLRNALLDAAIPFEDRRIAVQEWPPLREDQTFAGPYAGLPTLSWDRLTLAETLPIAAFLARRRGDYAGLDDAGIARLEAICSVCYVDIMVRTGEVIWADQAYPGADLAASLPHMLARLVDKLCRVERHCAEADWFGGANPVMADFFAVEALDTASYLLGPERAPKLCARVPRLAALHQRMRARPAIAAATRPERFSGRPDERPPLAYIRALDLSGCGL